MAISLASLQRSGERKPPRLMLYAGHGWGKTSLGAGAPNPVFMQLEDGLGEIEVPTFGILKTYTDVMDAIGSLYSESHEFKTVVLDTLDWLEPVIWQETCVRGGVTEIESYGKGYGKGYLAAVDLWRGILDGLNALRDEKGMMVIMLAHSEVKRYQPPDTEEYDRYQPKLHKLASAVVQENVDGVFFGNYRVSLVKDKPKDKDSRVHAVGGGQRVLYTTELPSHLAKNRWRMPGQISLPDDPALMWPTIAQHIPFFTAPTTTTVQKEAA